MVTPELSIVIPCYNESGNLPALCRRYRPVAERTTLELVLVDNGSTDDSARVLAEELGRPENHFAHAVHVPVNKGYGHGIQAGLHERRAPVIGFSHADLQSPPEDVLTAYQIYQREMGKGPCLIKGRRRGERPALDRGVTWCYNHFAGTLLKMTAMDVSGTPQTPDINAEPKIFGRDLLDRVLQGPANFTFDLFVLFAAHQKGCRVVEFETVYERRTWGQSKLASNPWVRLKTSLTAFGQVLKLWRTS